MAPRTIPLRLLGRLRASCVHRRRACGDELDDDEPSAASWGSGLFQFLITCLLRGHAGSGWVAWEDRAGKPGEETRTGERSVGGNAAARAAVTRLRRAGRCCRWRGLREREVDRTRAMRGLRARGGDGGRAEVGGRVARSGLGGVEEGRKEG